MPSTLDETSAKFIHLWGASIKDVQSKGGGVPMWTTSDGGGGSAINWSSTNKKMFAFRESVLKSDTQPPTPSTGVRNARQLDVFFLSSDTVQTFVNGCLPNGRFWTGGMSKKSVLARTSLMDDPYSLLHVVSFNIWTFVIAFLV